MNFKGTCIKLESKGSLHYWKVENNIYTKKTVNSLHYESNCKFKLHYDKWLFQKWVFLCLSSSFYTLLTPWRSLLKSHHQSWPLDESNSSCPFKLLLAPKSFQITWGRNFTINVSWGIVEVEGTCLAEFQAKLQQYGRKQRYGEVWREKLWRQHLMLHWEDTGYRG